MTRYKLQQIIKTKNNKWFSACQQQDLKCNKIGILFFWSEQDPLVENINWEIKNILYVFSDFFSLIRKPLWKLKNDILNAPTWPKMVQKMYLIVIFRSEQVFWYKSYLQIQKIKIYKSHIIIKSTFLGRCCIHCIFSIIC